MEENNSKGEPDLSDVIGKFKDILKEKDINLGKILGDEEDKSDPLDFDFDLDTILKFKSIYQKINDNNNSRNRLLYSLKPFLRDSRKKKLDEYIKIANLIGVIGIINDMNYGDFNGWCFNYFTIVLTLQRKKHRLFIISGFINDFINKIAGKKTCYFNYFITISFVSILQTGHFSVLPSTSFTIFAILIWVGSI